MTEIEYRAYREGDFRRLAEICSDEWQHCHASVAYAMAMCDNKIEQCYVALDGEDLVGYVYGFCIPTGTLILEFVYVKPEYRRRGICARLLEIIESNSGCSTAMAFYNKALHEHYQKLGYTTGENLEVGIKTIK